MLHGDIEVLASMPHSASATLLKSQMAGLMQDPSQAWEACTLLQVLPTGPNKLASADLECPTVNAGS